jgi:hypothetical protein
VDEMNVHALARLVAEQPDHPKHDLTARTELKDFQGADVLDGIQPNEDFLTMCSSPGVPPHRLSLAVGAVVLITRNLSGDLTNGTQMVVQRINPHSVQLVRPELWNGPDAAYPAASVSRIPRIVFQWTHGRVGLTVERQQFPLRLAYAVTFNKSQGKTLSRAVVDLRNPAFAHGQLYVALSRVAERGHIAVRRGPRRGGPSHARALRCHHQCRRARTAGGLAPSAPARPLSRCVPCTATAPRSMTVCRVRQAPTCCVRPCANPPV